MHSILWDNFCANQKVTNVYDITDLCLTGVLSGLMKRNTSREVSFDCIRYDGGTTDTHGPFTDSTQYHVDAYPAQSELVIFRDGIKTGHYGPEIDNGRLIHRSLIHAGTARPSVFLHYTEYPEFWGNSVATPPWLHYPRYFTVAEKTFSSDLYIRIISYSDEEMEEHGMWKEVIIDTDLSMAVLFARHYGSDIDDVWIMQHVEERDDWRQPELRTFDYHWTFSPW